MPPDGSDGPYRPGRTAVDNRRFRDCLGQFASGVTVVTVDGADGVHGTTVSSFTSVSLDPPLVMVSLDRRGRICGRLAGAPFGVNVLATDQRRYALHFAGRAGLPPERIGWRNSTGAPRLAGCAAFLDCAPWAAYDGGDHVLYVGLVRHFEAADAEPLIFHRGAFHELRRGDPATAWVGSLDHPAHGVWATADAFVGTRDSV